MKIEATSQIIEYDAVTRQSVVINKGDCDTVSDGFGQRMIDEERAIRVDELSQLDHDDDGEPGGSTAPESSDDLAELRKQYKDVLGKNPFPGWGADELQRRIDAAGNAGDAAGPPV